jgi:hypothetical protein
LGVTRIRTARLLLPAALVVFWSSGFIGATMAAATGAAASTTLLWRYVLTAAVLVSIALSRRRRYALGFLVREATIGLFAQSRSTCTACSGRQHSACRPGRTP